MLAALSRKLGALLRKNNLSIAVAESCTGGMLGASITAAAGSSAYFQGGVIAYSNRIKQEVLHVSKTILQKKGAVSAETVAAMATGAAGLCRTSCAIAVSGIAGPGGGNKKKPVGLVYIGIFLKKKTWIFHYNFRGHRNNIRKQAAEAGLRQIINLLEESSSTAIP